MKFGMQLNNCYLNREESESIKGLLIILIIIGHNYMLCNLCFDSLIFFWLYQFHVMMFFVLPFFYRRSDKPQVRKTFLKGLRRIYVPYIWIFTFSVIIYSLLYHKGMPSFIQFLQGLLPLRLDDITEVAGVKFLWFAPAFILFSSLYAFFQKYGWGVKTLVIVVSFVSFMLVFSERGSHIVFLKVGYYFFCGLFIAMVYRKSSDLIRMIATFSFILLSVLFFMQINLIPLYQLLLPITFWGMMLFCKSYLSKVYLLKELGKYSFPIYMIHFYINSALEFVLPFTVVNGVISLVITVGVSYWGIILLQKIPVFNAIIFPK